MKRAFILLFAAGLAACNVSVDQPNLPTDPATETFDPALGVDIATMTKTPSGAYFKELVIGTGATLTGQPNITFTYIGYVKNGASFESGQQINPYSLQLLVSGLQEGIQGMKVGGQRLVVVPSALGFGRTVVGPVPGNSTLIYRFELDGIVQ
jgi:FKBP-type peptidyl-prolyl cis-trans isomerase